jgi:hypothetical protein
MEPVDFINTLGAFCLFVCEGGDVLSLMLPSALVLVSFKVGCGVERYKEFTVQLHYTTAIFQMYLKNWFLIGVCFIIDFTYIGK